jgi:hypothetical protein
MNRLFEAPELKAEKRAFASALRGPKHRRA